MSIKADSWIRRMAEDHGMIEPFSGNQVSEGRISYGLSSYGYDLRLADDFKIFTPPPGTLINPKVNPCRVLSGSSGRVLRYSREHLCVSDGP